MDSVRYGELLLHHEQLGLEKHFMLMAFYASMHSILRWNDEDHIIHLFIFHLPSFKIQNLYSTYVQVPGLWTLDSTRVGTKALRYVLWYVL